jgi:hypothetical protein
MVDDKRRLHDAWFGTKTAGRFPFRPSANRKQMILQLSWDPLRILKSDGKVAVRTLIKIAKANPTATPSVWAREIKSYLHLKEDYEIAGGKGKWQRFDPKKAWAWADTDAVFGRSENQSAGRRLLENTIYLPIIFGTSEAGESAPERAAAGYSDLWSKLGRIGFKRGDKTSGASILGAQGHEGRAPIAEGWYMGIEINIGHTRDGDWIIGKGYVPAWLWVDEGEGIGTNHDGEWRTPKTELWFSGHKSVPGFDHFDTGGLRIVFDANEPDPSGESGAIGKLVATVKKLKAKAARDFKGVQAPKLR